MTAKPLKIAAITGHRLVHSRALDRIQKAMHLLIDNSTIDEIYFGGAKGTDTEALRAALQYRKGRRPRLVVVVPDTIDSQPSNTRHWTDSADEVIELGNPITDEDGYSSYRIRNEYLVNVCTFLVAFFNGDFKTGTGQAINYATRIGKPVYQIRA